MRRSALLFLLTLVTSSGCLCTGSLDANGGGRLTLRYHLVSVLFFEQHKAMLQSAGVKVVNSAMTPDKWATFDLSFADIRQLSTTPFFSHLQVDLTEDKPGSRTLAATLDNPAAQPMPEVVQNYLGRDFKVSLELPGKVLASNATTTAGRTVSWSLPVGDVATRSRVDFKATFETGS